MASSELNACRVALAMIRQDAEDDAKALDGTAFTGRDVGTQFGNTLAMIDALAGIVDTLTTIVGDMLFTEAAP